METEYYRTIKDGNDNILLHEIKINKSLFDISLADSIGANSGSIDATKCIVAIDTSTIPEELFLKREDTGIIKLIFVYNSISYHIDMDINSIAGLLFGKAIEGQYINVQQLDDVYVLKIYNNDFISFHLSKIDSEALISYISNKHDYTFLLHEFMNNALYNLKISYSGTGVSHAHLYSKKAKIDKSYELYRINKFIFNYQIFSIYHPDDSMSILILDSENVIKPIGFRGNTNIINPDINEYNNSVYPPCKTSIKYNTDLRDIKIDWNEVYEK